MSLGSLFRAIIALAHRHDKVFEEMRDSINKYCRNITALTTDNKLVVRKRPSNYYTSPWPVILTVTFDGAKFRVYNGNNEKLHSSDKKQETEAFVANTLSGYLGS